MLVAAVWNILAPTDIEFGLSVLRNTQLSEGWYGGLGSYVSTQLKNEDSESHGAVCRACSALGPIAPRRRPCADRGRNGCSSRPRRRTSRCWTSRRNPQRQHHPHHPDQRSRRHQLADLQHRRRRSRALCSALGLQHCVESRTRPEPHRNPRLTERQWADLHHQSQRRPLREKRPGRRRRPRRLHPQPRH